MLNEGGMDEWSVFDFKQIYCVNLTDGKYTWRRIGQGLGSAPSPRDKLSCWVYKRRWLSWAMLWGFVAHQHAWSSYVVPQPRLLRRIWSQTADRRGQQEQKLHCGWSIMGNLSPVLQLFAVFPYLLVIWLCQQVEDVFWGWNNEVHVFNPTNSTWTEPKTNVSW